MRERLLVAVVGVVLTLAFLMAAAVGAARALEAVSALPF
jgi:hypothetical protein